MKKLILCILLVMGQQLLMAQKLYFVYLQSDNKQPFYLRMGTRTIQSGNGGYLILSKLRDSIYHFNVGSPDNKFPEQSFTVTVNKKDHGYLLKDFVLDELLCALGTVLRGERYLSPRIRHMEIDPTSKRNSGKLLTARQLEILRLVASGKTTKEIARNLSISPKTVEFHRSRLMERTGANDVTGLTRFALQNGVLC